jgi:hypothetical protein
MPSTYSTSLGLELIGNGEQAGTWGTTTNNNLGTLLEAAIAGVEPITLTGGDYTLTDYNGLPDQARSAVLVFGGLLAAPCNVIAPAVDKVYIVRNFSNATVTVKTSGGNGVAIANAASEVIFCDGTNFYSATQFNYIDGNLTVTGTATANNLVATNNITLGKDLFGNASTGQIYVPVGTEAQRTASPINGVIRYNTDLQAYEGYANSNWVTFNVSRQGLYSVGYWFVAGGGGGGVGGQSPVLLAAGGGGAGGYLSSASAGLANITPGVTYTVVVGAGGASGGASGSNTNALGFVAIGGGGGGTRLTPSGKSGGSGGGGGGQGGATGGSGFPGQGNDGAGANGASGGGGGGATGGGSGLQGGAGTSTSITGISVAYCGGGGGGGYDGSSGGSGGAGGGGAGGDSQFTTRSGTSGTIYTGGGGGGGSTIQGTDGEGAGSGGNGGSGVAILSIPTTRYTGTTTGSPLVSTFGNATILTFLASGTYTA